MARTETWEKITSLVNAGKAPRVTVTPAQEVKPVYGRPGRPSTVDLKAPFKHYATPSYGFSHPKCLWCRKRLGVKDIEVCSEECRNKAVQWLEHKLARLNGRVIIPITREAAEMMASREKKSKPKRRRAA